MKPMYVNALSVGENPFAGQAFGQSLGVAKNAMGSHGVQGFGRVTNEATPKFGDMLNHLAGGLNQTMQAPDAMMREHALYGTYDIHDIMLANSKAELAVNLTAQFTTKVMQAYDRILQIQV
ncbi:MAG: flagellar hook-basal body complex protein FliE [Vampirovibrionales bacterium]